MSFEHLDCNISIRDENFPCELTGGRLARGCKSSQRPWVQRKTEEVQSCKNSSSKPTEF